MKKPYCYICDDEELSSENRSSEHIIQNCIGGHLKSSDLVCNDVNMGLFNSFDNRLSDSLIFFRSFIKFKIDRDRGHEITIKGKDEEGFPYRVGSDLEGKVLGFDPAIGFDKSKETFKYPLLREKDSLVWYQKQMSYTDEQMQKVKEQRTIIDGGEKTILYGKEYFSMFNSSDLFKAITKITTNFYIYKGEDKFGITGPINFLKGNHAENFKVGYFYPKEKLDYQHDDEISHILYLKGDKQQGILYCYIELFNCHCFIVSLNIAYSGNDFEHKYIWDLKNGTELDKDLNLNVCRYEVINRNYDFFNKKYDDFHERLKRLNNILDIKLVEEKILVPVI